MITIYAEKPDVGTKIAAALDGIYLDNGTKVSFENLEKYEKQIKAFRTKQGYFKIHWEGQEVLVTWGYGHMCELKQAYDYDESLKQWSNLPLPYIPEEYGIKLMNGAKEQYHVIKQCFLKSELLICATDNDREGDLIFDYLYRYMKCKIPFKRAIFNKQAKDEYRKAFSFKNLVDSKDRMPVIEAGRARSAGDFLVGAGPTVAMTLQNPNTGVLSVGRVQTATLNIIVQREHEISNFKPKDYYVIQGTFKTKDGETYTGMHSKKRFDSQVEASRILKKLMDSDKKGVITSIKQETYQKKKPNLYNLDSLQMEANKKYGFSLDKTLKLAQSLYEHGYITYPRTDSVYLPEDMEPEIQQVLLQLTKHPKYSAYHGTEEIHSKQYFDNSKIESHYAIVPTTKIPQHLEKDQEKLYHLVATSVLCMAYPVATMSKTEFTTSVNGEDFLTTGTSIVNPGFYTVIGKPREKVIPTLQKGDIVSSKFEKKGKKTTPPERYTAASLLNAMLNCGKTIEDEELKALMANGPGGKPRGLGRPSSRASIVETLEKRQYIETKGKTIYPTERGIFMIDSFPVDDLKSAEMTALWEKRLDDIEHGTDTYEKFMKDLEESVIKWTNEIMENHKNLYETEYECPICGKKIRKLKWGYACSDKDCEFTFGVTPCGVPLTKEQIDDFFYTGRTGLIRNMKGKSGKRFDAEIIWNPELEKTEFKFPEMDTSCDYVCPVCKKPMKKLNWGYACTECSFTFGKEVCKKTLSEKQISQFFETGSTDLIRGFKGKTGKPFNAKIVYNPKEKKTSFEYEQCEFVCPICGRKLRPTSAGYGCTGYKDGDCNFFIGQICGVKLSKDEVEQLLNGEQVYLTGMQSKKGNRFDAMVEMELFGENAGKINFVED